MAIQKPFAVIPTPLGTVTTGNETGGAFASHLGEFKNPGMVWRTAGASNAWVRGNFGAAKAVDFISIMATNAQAGTTIRLRLGDSQAEVDGTADYDTGAIPLISPATTREDGIYHSHFELPSTQTKQWWRIDIAGHSGDFQASMLVLGLKRQFADFYNPDFEFGYEDTGDIKIGAYGVVEETPGLILSALNMTFGWMTETDRATKFQPLAKALGKRNVAFWCFDPDATTQRQEKTYLGWFTEIPVFKPSANRQDRWQAPFRIFSIL